MRGALLIVALYVAAFCVSGLYHGRAEFNAGVVVEGSTGRAILGLILGASLIAGGRLFFRIREEVSKGS